MVWVAGELQSTGAKPDEFMQGATAAIEAIAGGTSATASVRLKSGELTFLTKLDVPFVTSGTLVMRCGCASTPTRITAEPLTEGVRLDPTAGRAEAPAVPAKRDDR